MCNRTQHHTASDAVVDVLCVAADYDFPNIHASQLSRFFRHQSIKASGKAVSKMAMADHVHACMNTHARWQE